MHNLIPVEVARLSRSALEQTGLYECLREAGVALPTTANEVIGARVASHDECKVLDMVDGSAVQTMTRTAWGASGRGVEYGSHIYRADRYAFEHNITDL